MTGRSRLIALCEAVREVGAGTDEIAHALDGQAAALKRASARAAALGGRNGQSSAVAFQVAARACADAARNLRRCGTLARAYAAAKCGSGYHALAGAIVLSGFTSPGGYPVGPDGSGYRAEPTDRKHVLDGDDRDGGHRAHTGKPGKSEFPARWTDDTVMDRIADVARAPETVVLQPAEPGSKHDPRWVAIGTRDDVTIFVVLRLDGSLVTAFPRSGRGVIVNPAGALEADTWSRTSS
jgi:hypothetical protein